jgi:hypothetical protein
MAVLTKVKELGEWLDTKSDDYRAAITIRIALRGLLPLFNDGKLDFSEKKVLRAINLALVHLNCIEKRDRTKLLFEWF